MYGVRVRCAYTSRPHLVFCKACHFNRPYPVVSRPFLSFPCVVPATGAKVGSIVFSISVHVPVILVQRPLQVQVVVVYGVEGNDALARRRRLCQDVWACPRNPDCRPPESALSAFNTCTCFRVLCISHRRRPHDGGLANSPWTRPWYLYPVSSFFSPVSRLIFIPSL